MSIRRRSHTVTTSGRTLMTGRRAWLEFEVRPHDGGSAIRQTALFDPVGLAGLAYWYLLHPLHRLVFSAMIDNIARAAAAGPRPARTASP